MRAVRTDERTDYRPGEDAETFEQRMLKTFYQQECEHGSRFHVPGFTNSQLKEIWTRPEPAEAR